MELPRLSCLNRRGPLARLLNRPLEVVAMPVRAIPVCKIGGQKDQSFEAQLPPPCRASLQVLLPHRQYVTWRSYVMYNFYIRPNSNLLCAYGKSYKNSEITLPVTYCLLENCNLFKAQKVTFTRAFWNQNFELVSFLHVILPIKNIKKTVIYS